MIYHSTRNEKLTAAPARAVLEGIAPDGGLYVCDPGKLEFDWQGTLQKDTMSMAADILGVLLPDFQDMNGLVRASYAGKFASDDLTPLVPVGERYVLELYHGPTSAFKDVALSVLPRLVSAAAKQEGAGDVVILTATSGDTGKAALEGFHDVSGTRIMVFYPAGGVSPVQEAQMVTQEGGNVRVCAIRGNFDDAQTGVKKLFGNKELEKEMAEAGFQFSSANSINIGRLVPQVVYYVYAYAKLLENEQIENGEEINVVVPTGNFGNILAAYFAKHMGVPIKTLICASNDNKVLYDFFTTGTYDRKREFILTNSPSMDILISSNLERLIYLSTGCDAAADAALMKDLSEKGSYTVTESMRQFMSDFRGGFATEAQNEATIRKIFEDTGYLIDTHTGVAATVYNAYKAETGDQTKTVIASTASPYKFSHSVLEAIKGKSAVEGKDEFAVVDELSEVSGTQVPKAVEDLRSAVIRHNTECDVDKMGETVKNILGIA